MKKMLTMICAAALVLLVGCSSQSTTSTTADQESMTDEEKVNLLSEAYTYLYPLIMMNTTMVAHTNAEQASSAGAPINQFSHTAELRNAETKSVVTPNVDTLYSTAWLDISDEPIVYTVPETDRFMETQVLDAWSNTAEAVTEAGVYMIAMPDQEAATPEGVTRIDVPTSTVWMICRPLLDGDGDLPNVVDLQNQMSLIPLSEYSNSGDYRPPQGEFSEKEVYVPVDKVNSMNANTFFNLANQLLSDNPPAPEDAELVSRISEIQIGAGLTFDSASIISDEKKFEQAWEELKTACYASWEESVVKYSKEVGDWVYMGEPVGDFGTAYEYRAATALKALGANPVYVAMYLEADADSSGEALSGENTYVIHFGEAPPVIDKGFWSVTMYGDDNFLVENEIDRYLINDRSDVVYNEDGSLDITVSVTPPENTSNWLPAPEGGFHLWLRIYSPDIEAINNGWQAPTISVQ